MLLFLESGRLGNQLFQYAALRTLCRGDERLVLLGFDALRSAFENVDARFALSTGSALFGVAQRMRPGVDRLVSSLAVLPVIGERFEGERCKVEVTPGRIHALRYAKEAYFQSDELFDEAVVSELQMRDGLAVAAREKLAAVDPQGRHRVFVHVRRGDYLHWPTPESPAVLPDSWYRACMDRMRRRYRDPFFVLCSDEPQYVRDRFGDFPDAHVATGGELEDFALMCHCDSGIASASAYSWWAAYFVKRRSAGATLFAPEFWIGHRERRWFPIGVKCAHFEYVPV
jgi:hypothetical protein